jgi:hypothetical protein
MHVLFSYSSQSNSCISLLIWVSVKDQRTKHLKDTHVKEFELHLQFFYQQLHILYLMNTIGRTYVFKQGINKHALPITVTKIREGPIFNLNFVVASL